MTKVFCDSCGKEMTGEDLDIYRARGNDIVFDVKVIGLQSHYCQDCIRKAIQVHKKIKEWDIRQ